MLLISKISGLLLFSQIFCISGVPHRFVEVEDNQPTFFRGSVEHSEYSPLDDDRKGSLRDAAADFEEEDEAQFSRAAVESIPTTKLSYFQPLRSAVEHNPRDDDEDFDIFTQKQRFMKIVSPKRNRHSKAMNFDAYIIPSHFESSPNRYRGSPYQQLVDAATYERLQSAQMQESSVMSHASLKMGQSKAKSNFNVICHITNWSFYRKGEGKFVPENLNAKLCTHIIYAYATLDPESLELREFDPWGDIENDLYSRTVNLDKNVPVLLGMGGWTDSSGDKYSRLMSDPRARQNFISRAIGFLRQYGFSGAHIDWNYPTCPQSDCRVGPASDKSDFTAFCREFKKAADPYGLLLSVSISGYKEIIARAYDLKPLSETVSFFTVMTYDYHGSWETVTGHVSPLFGDDKDKYPQYNTEYALKLLTKLGADKSKMNVGVPFYGQTFMLSMTRPGQGFNSPADGPGEPGEVTNQPGMLAYNEICNRIRKSVWKKGSDPSGKSGPYATDSSQWVGFDDVEAVTKKTSYAMNEGYGGIAAWTVDLDDFSNRCCQGAFPLLSAINRACGRIKTPAPVNDCTRPTPPVTPTPPLMVATVDTGAAGIPASQSTLGDVASQSTTSSWWTQPSTTSAWWTQPTTTKRASRPTSSPSTITSTTRRTTRSTPRTTTSRYDEELTAVPVPVNVQPIAVEGKCEPGEYRPHPIRCNEYLVCSNGGLLTQYCPSGLDWNSRNKHCDWPASAQCTIKQEDSPPVSPPVSQRPIATRRPTTSRTTETSTMSVTTTKSTTKLTTKPTYPTKTTSRKPTRTTMRPTTTEFDYTDPTTTTSRPTYYETTTTELTTRKPIKKSCINGMYYPHKDCKKFYICNNNKRTPSGCPDGTQFSPDLQTCDFEENVKCVSKKKYLKLLQRQYQRTGIFNALLLRASTGEGCNVGEYSSYPGKCSSYLECVHEVYMERPCSEGLSYNPATGGCDWPQNVDCKNDPSLDTNEIGDDEEQEAKPDQDQVVNSGSNNQIPDFEFDQGVHKPSSTSTTTSRPSKPANPPVISSFQTIAVPDKVEPLNGNSMLVCYFTNWAWYRPGIGKYLPDHIDPNLCTHIVYGFAVLNYDELTIKSHDSWADTDNKFYERVVEFKRKGVKVTLAIGGWNDSAGDKYSRLVRNPAARKRFIESVIVFLEKYGFEGLDLDWEYPVCWQVDCTKGHADEKRSFALFVKELSEAFKPRGLLLSTAVSPSKTVIDAGYDVPELSKYFDWIAVMCYDYHGQWDKKTGHVAPLYRHPEDEVDFFNTNYTMHYWIKLGAPPNKLVMGMPLYGQSFTLADAKNNGLNAKAPGPGQAGEFTRAPGFLSYYEICDRIFNQGWTVVQDPEGRLGPYAYKGNQWVSFDDQATLQRKTRFIRELGLAGGMIWALDLDDFTGRCGQGSHPLLKIIHSELQSTSISHLPPSPNVPEEEEIEYYDDDEDEILEKPSEPEVLVDADHVNQKPVEDIDEDEDEEDAEEDDESNEIDDAKEKLDFMVVCYFTNWAWYRPGIGKFVPEDIDANLCSHIVYGFAVLNRDSLTIQPHDSWADKDNKFYERVVEYKRKGIKVTVAIGGWNDSAGDKYSRLVRDAAARSRFIKNVIEFIQANNFDGLDLDWEYPVCWQVECDKGKPDEKEYFAKFVEELSREFKPRGLLLSTAVSPSKKVIDAGYDIPRLSDHFDWISVMAYDYHGQWDKKTGHVAPMYYHPDDFESTFNANFSINYWLDQGADPRKIIMGMPMYGQSFSLADRTNEGLNSPTYGGGEAGPETRARGFLSYYEICTNIRKKNWNVVRDFKGRIGPYAHSGDQWVSFDDAPMIRHKSEFVKSLGLGGAMIWALDLDDFKNVCGCEEYPLLRTINRVLRNYPGPHNNCILESKKSKRPVEPTTKRPIITQPATHKPTSTVYPPKKTTTQPRKTTTTTEITSFGDEYPEIPELDDDKRSCQEGRLFIPHETDCNKYYQCDHGVLIERHCSPGLMWNSQKMFCDWPSKTTCQSVSHDADEDADNDIDSVPSQKPSTEWSWTSAKPTSSTPKKPTAPTLTTPKPTVRPVVSDTPVTLTGNEKYKMVCYFTNWAWYRPGVGKYKPDDIDPNLCTHIVYGFAVLNRDTLVLRTHDSWADIDNNFYTRVAEFKQKGIKVSLAIGGWNDSLGDKYSRLVRDAVARARFIKHAIEFIIKYGFEGLDLDWEYPVCWQVDCTKGKPDEKEHFALFVKELSEAFKPEGLLLSAAVSPAKKVIDAGYDIPEVSKYFDWIAVMCYDYHGQWDKKTGHVAPLFEHPEDWETTFNAEYSIKYWIDHGAPPSKLVMGMPMYGQSFSLEKASNNGLNAIAPGPGQAGEFTRAAGFLAFYEICDRVNRGGWTVVRDPEGRIGPYAFKDRQWVSYDDVEDIRRKTKFVKDMGLAGAMIWALDLDDFRNRCGCGYHPLLTAINLELGRISTSRRSDCT